MIEISLRWGPFALLFSAVLFRVIAIALPDSPKTTFYKTLLAQIGFIHVAIALCGFVFLIFADVAAAGIGFVLAIILAVAFIDVEMQTAGVQNRARQVEFLWVIATAVKTGRLLPDEIEAYARGAWGRRRKLLVEMAERLREGDSMSELAVPQGLLPQSAMMQIHAGITSKSLEQALAETATRATRDLVDDQESRCPASKLIYPIALVPICFGALAYWMYKIEPKYSQIFHDFHTELPEVTSLMIRITNVVSGFWLLLLLPFVYAPIGLFAFVTVAEYHGWKSVFQSRLGRWFVRFHTPDVLRSLSQGIRNGVPADQIIVPIYKYSGSINLRQRLESVADEMASGSPCWQSLKDAGLLNVREAVALESAQRTGNLPWVLTSMATAIEQRWMFRLRVVLEFVQPALLLGVAFIVALIAIMMFIPLVKLLHDMS